MNEKNEKRVVVTRHKALVEYLRERDVIDDRATVIGHASPDDVRDKHVVGVLPLGLAALATSVTEVPLQLPAALRGTELTVEQVREYAAEPATYVVIRVDVEWKAKYIRDAVAGM